jgi:hypothetical protein
MSTPPASAFPQTASWNSSLFGGPGVTVGSDIIYPALRILRLVRPGHGPQSEWIVEALAALNAMLDSWNTERLTVPAVLRSTYTLVSGTQSYTIGPSGTFMVSDRPSRIEKAGLLDITNNPAQPIELPMEVLTVEQWKAIPVKTVTSTIPLKLYYDQSLVVGNGTLYVWPVPSVANQLALYLWQTMLQFQTVEEPFALYPGYLRAIQYNLAVELAPRFETAVLSPLTLDTAIKSKGAIKALNAPILDVRCDPALVGSTKRFDWRTGQ